MVDLNLFTNNKFELLMGQLSMNPSKKNPEKEKQEKKEIRKIGNDTRNKYRGNIIPEIRIPPMSPRFSRESTNDEFFSPRSMERQNSFQNYSKQECRRLYVSNIPEETTEKALRALFSDYGELTSATFEEQDVETKTGFVAFKDVASVEKVLNDMNNLKLSGKQVKVRKATSQKTQLFVGGYDLYMAKTDLVNFFSKYGEVTDFVMKYSSEGISRCFGFVTFRDSEDAVNQLVADRFVECMGKTVEIKRADKSKRNFNSFGGTPMRKKFSNSSRFNRDSLEKINAVPISPRANTSPRRFYNSSQGSEDLPLSPRSINRSSSGGSYRGYYRNYDSESNDVPLSPRTYKPYIKPEEADKLIGDTSMYSRKYFAPTRPGMKNEK